MSKKPFGGLFDLNRDGRESLSEQWLAYRMSNGAMPTAHLPKFVEDAFQSSISTPSINPKNRTKK